MAKKKQTPKQIESLDPAKVIETPSEDVVITWGDPHAKMTAQSYAGGFDDYAEMIRKKRQPFAHRQADPDIKQTYDIYRQVVQSWRNNAIKELKDCPALPDVPALIGNDYFGGMIHLEDYSRSCAATLRGKDKQDKPTKPVVPTETEPEESNPAVTLDGFMRDYCDLKGHDIASKRESICKMNRQKPRQITLPPRPPGAGEWKPGRRFVFYVHDLEANWETYRKAMPTLPLLKARKSAT